MRLSRLQELTDLCVCAQSFIAQGKVLVDGQPVTKAGTKLADDPSKPGQVVLTAEVPRYVSSYAETPLTGESRASEWVPRSRSDRGDYEEDEVEGL